LFRLRRLFNGDIYSIGHVKHYRGSHIRIESTPDIMVEVDGELLGGTPLEFKIHPRCVRVIVNKDYLEN
jgi:diacylglycerol kinase family enzyme